jgi:hypothetical protein
VPSKTPSIARFSGITAATKRSIPCSAASAVSRSSRRVPIPRRRVAQANVFADRDDALVPVDVGEGADENAPLAPIGLEEMRDELFVDRPHAVETEVETSFGKAAEEGGETVPVLLRRRPEPQRRAVAQDHVDRGSRRVIARYRQARPRFLISERRDRSSFGLH